MGGHWKEQVHIGESSEEIISRMRERDHQRPVVLGPNSHRLERLRQTHWRGHPRGLQGEHGGGTRQVLQLSPLTSHQRAAPPEHEVLRHERRPIRPADVCTQVEAVALLTPGQDAALPALRELRNHFPVGTEPGEPPLRREHDRKVHPARGVGGAPVERRRERGDHDLEALGRALSTSAAPQARAGQTKPDDPA